MSDFAPPHIYYIILIACLMSPYAPTILYLIRVSCIAMLPHARYLSSYEEDMVVKILQTHMTEGCRVDSELLLEVVEDIMNNASYSDELAPEAHLERNSVDNTQKADKVGIYGSVAQTIYKLSREVMNKCFIAEDSHVTTMTLFELLGNYSWDGKVVLVLAAFATSYGEFLLTSQLCSTSPLAVSIAMFTKASQHLQNRDTLKPCFKAFNCLTKILVNVAKCIVEFEGLPLKYITLNIIEMATTKYLIHVAAYWVTRSAVMCSLLIVDLIARDHEQMTRASMTWELWSLVLKVGSIHNHLRKQMDRWDEHIEEKVGQKLVSLFEENHVDNQEVLSTLFSMKNRPLIRECFLAEKYGLDILRNKEVVLLISRLDIPPQQSRLLLQQMFSHPEDNSERSYEIVWVPLPNSTLWTHDEEKAFRQLANNLPWFSISKPWLLRLAVVNYIKEFWHFKHDPLMVVMDRQGRITCPNAIDIVTIWGTTAYPFSVSKEGQLWDEANWSLELIIGDIDPLIPIWIQKGRTVCLYGSNNMEWIRDFSNRIMNIKRNGFSVELMYVGAKNPSERVSKILATINEEKLSGYLSEDKMYFFWARLLSISSLKTRLGKDEKTDVIMREVVSLLSHDAGENGWAMISNGSSNDILVLHGMKLIELLSLCQIWGEDVGKVGFFGAIRNALDPPLLPRKHCHCRRMIPYNEGSSEGIVVCEECTNPMRKYIIYQCVKERID